jgi:hypothetical protein
VSVTKSIEEKEQAAKNQQTYDWLLTRLHRRNETLRSLARDCDCTVPTIQKNLMNTVTKSRVKNALCEILEPEEIRRLGWKTPSLMDELRGLLESLSRKVENMKSRIESLERKRF